MIKFYLVRHGMKESIPVDPGLTEIGIKQAETTAKYLATIPFQAIIASPKKRTQQTAEIIAKQLQLPILLDDKLRERMEWEKDESFDDFLALWDKTDLDRDYMPTHGTSSHEKGRQMKDTLEKLAKEYMDGNILIITHGGSVGDMLRTLFGEKNIPHITNPISGANYVDILECSITIVEKGNNVYKLAQLGDVGHLSIPLI